MKIRGNQGRERDNIVAFSGEKGLPEEEECEFDHGDVDNSTGRVFDDHTSTGTVEVFDGKEGRGQDPYQNQKKLQGKFMETRLLFSNRCKIR